MSISAISSSMSYPVQSQRNLSEESTESAAEKIAEANSTQTAIKSANAAVGKGTNIDTVA